MSAPATLKPSSARRTMPAIDPGRIGLRSSGRFAVSRVGTGGATFCPSSAALTTNAGRTDSNHRIVGGAAPMMRLIRPHFRSTVAVCLQCQLFADFGRRKAPAGASEKASRMRAATAEMKPLDRRPVPRESQQRTHGEELIRRQLSMENVSANGAGGLLDVFGCQRLRVDDQ